MRDDDDDDYDDDKPKGPSLFSRLGGFFVGHPFISGIFFAILGFYAIATMLPPHPMPPAAVVPVASSEAPTETQAEATPDKLPERDVDEMRATPPGETAKPREPVKTVLADVAILVTDVGLSRRVAEAIDKSLPVETSLAISPYSPDPAAMAKAFADTGRDVWVQIAAQSRAAGIDPGPLAVSISLGKAENLDLIKRQISAAGSKPVGIFIPSDADITLQSDVWRDIALEIIANNKMILDGTPAKVATEVYVQRSESKISAYLKTDAVIDASGSPAAFDAALAGAVPMVLRLKESIIVIKQPSALSVEHLQKWIDTLAEQGIRLVPASKFTGLKP